MYEKVVIAGAGMVPFRKPGQAALYHLDMNGIPIFNVNNNCASGSSAFALASRTQSATQQHTY